MKTIRYLILPLLLVFSLSAYAAGEHDILLRGILKIGDNETFSISSKAGTQSKWLKIGQSFNDYLLKSYDPENETLTIETDDETFELGMAGASEAATEIGTLEERLAEAQHVMDMMNFEKMMDETMEAQISTMTEMMSKQMGGMDEDFVQFQNEAMKRMFKSIDWKPIKEGLTKVYADVYTKDELKGISSFYASPVGQASLEKMPQVQQKTMQVMMPAVMEATQQYQKELMQYMREQKQKKTEE